MFQPIPFKLKEPKTKTEEIVDAIKDQHDRTHPPSGSSGSSSSSGGGKGKGGGK